MATAEVFQMLKSNCQILEDGSTKKIDGRFTTETGSFVFRLSPETAKYRVTLKSDNVAPVSKDVEIDGAAVYRVALSFRFRQNLNQKTYRL